MLPAGLVFTSASLDTSVDPSRVGPLPFIPCCSLSCRCSAVGDLRPAVVRSVGVWRSTARYHRAGVLSLLLPPSVSLCVWRHDRGAVDVGWLGERGVRHTVDGIGIMLAKLVGCRWLWRPSSTRQQCPRHLFFEGGLVTSRSEFVLAFPGIGSWWGPVSQLGGGCSCSGLCVLCAVESCCVLRDVCGACDSAMCVFDPGVGVTPVRMVACNIRCCCGKIWAAC